MIKRYLLDSSRLQANGLLDILLDTLKYSFKGATSTAPKRAAPFLETLYQPNHAITRIPRRGRITFLISPTPSWLTSGRQRHITFLHDLFYGAQDSCHPRPTHCHLCNAPLGDHSLWRHLLTPCPRLRTTAASSAQWLAFVNLLDSGLQGLAIYTCLPLLY